MHPKASGIRLYFICASAMAPLAVAMSVIASPPKIDDPTWSGKEGSPVRSRTAPLLTGSPQHLRSVVAGTSPTAKPDPAMPADFGEVVRETLRKAQYEIVALESDASAATPADYQARNPLHQLRASFSTDGVTLRSLSEAQGAWEFGLSLAAVGYEGELRAVTSPTIVVKDNGVDYLRDGLVEWYVNDDRGLEQGFTIHSAPPGTRNRTPSGSAGAIAPETLEVRLDLTGNLAAKLVDGGSAVLLRDGSGTGVLRVKDLFAFDATGRVLPAEFALDGSQFALLIDVHGAVYPVTIDPLIVTEQAKLTAADAAAGDDWFGHSVAISGDTALVGAPNDDGPAGTEQGSAYVFVRSGTVWNLRAKLTASDAAPYDYFGYSVALSGDTALVGAFPEDGPAGEAQGSAYVFTRSGTVWSQQAKLTASDAAAFDYFGFSVALSGDTALVGTPFDDALLPFWDYGAAYVFVRSGTVWSQQAKLTAADDADCTPIPTVSAWGLLVLTLLLLTAAKISFRPRRPETA